MISGSSKLYWPTRLMCSQCKGVTWGHRLSGTGQPCCARSSAAAARYSVCQTIMAVDAGSLFCAYLATSPQEADDPLHEQHAW